jgi:hypothetical protein
LPIREYAVAFTFPYSPEAAKSFFAALHKAGSSFPYEAPHQVAHVTGGGGSFVAVLVQLENKNDESVEVKKRLDQWFTESGAGSSYDDDEWLTAPLPDRKKGSLSAVLGSSYNILQTFGNIGSEATAKTTAPAPRAVPTEIVHSNYAKDLYCPKCNKKNASNRWPARGDFVPYFSQIERGTFSVPVTCPHCHVEWHVVWDSNPGAIGRVL